MKNPITYLAILSALVTVTTLAGMWLDAILARSDASVNPFSAAHNTSPDSTPES